MKFIFLFTLSIIGYVAHAQTDFKISNISLTHPCNDSSGGRIFVAATGGTIPYKYSINGGQSFQGSQTFQNLTAGQYKIVVLDSFGKPTRDSAVILNKKLLTIVGTPTNLNCQPNSGSIQATATGGTLPFKFNWSNGATGPVVTGLPVGTYIVTVTDFFNCTTFDSVTLTQDGFGGKKYIIGDTTPCGIVFYADSITNPNNNCSSRYLVCAFNDENSGIAWRANSYLVTNAVSDMLFAQNNADRILEVQGTADVYAASVCNSKNITGQDTTCKGWYLPSKTELRLMYLNLVATRPNPLGNFSNTGYWSSLEKNKKKAWIVDFLNGREIVNNKTNKYPVRPVREFIVQ